MSRTHGFPPGAPCWLDLMTSDRDSSVAFYTGLLGWTADEPNPEFAGYSTFRKDGDRVAGVMHRQPGDQTPDTWTPYLWTEDAAATLDAVRAAGGVVHFGPHPVGDMGAMAFFTDPAGAGIGLWQPETHRGFDIVAEPGAPAWFELLTRDFVGTLAFYQGLFGYGTHVIGDTDEFRYFALTQGEEWLAGVMDVSRALPEGSPLGWGVVFSCDDTDAALSRVPDLGGTVLEAAMDTPWGRLGQIADPTGVRFSLVSGEMSA